MRSIVNQTVRLLLILTTVVAASSALGQTVTIAVKAEPNTLDPHKVVGRQSEAFLANIFDGLTARDADGTLVPGLAESWEQVGDTTWRFHLRHGVSFQNGEPFDSESVRFTLERAGNPDSPATTWSQINTITGVDVVDAYTVDIHTVSPDVLLPARLAELFGPMLPPVYTVEAGDDFGTHPVGTGPFVLKEWVKNERLVLAANEDYWRGAPSVKEIVVRPIAEDATRVSALIAGEVDLIEGLPHVMVDLIDSRPDLRVERVSASRVFYISIDASVKPLDDVRVRQALNYAIDRQAIIDRLFGGLGRPAATIISAQAFGFDPSVEPYPYDPVKAKELLAEAGYPNGFSIEFDYFSGSVADHYALSQAVAGYWTQIGIDVKENAYELGVFQEKRGANQAAPLYVYSLGDVFLEPFWLVEWLAAGDMSRRYSDPEVNDLVKEIRSTFDADRRVELYSEVQRLMKDDAQHAFLFQIDTLWGANDRVNFTLRADEVPWFYPLSLAD